MTHGSGARVCAQVIAACCALALTPAVADAAAKKPAKARKHSHAHEANGKKPGGKVHAIGRGQRATVITPAPQPDNGLGDRMGQGPSMQLAAMTTAINAAPAYFAGRKIRCAAITPVLASQPGNIMAGNFRDETGNCYVWLNMQKSEMLTGSEICKTTLHEMGHLADLGHSTDPTNVMFAPFQADPIPGPCLAPPAPDTPDATTCPPGATNADYCQAAAPKKNKGRPGIRAASVRSV